MTTEKITLYTYALSPFGMKVYWALAYKGLDFTLCYVSPLDQAQIDFTGQNMVPVLKIGDEWRLDSGPLCEWLDELYPDQDLAGSNDQERDAIRQADQWVTDRVIGLCFRCVIDDDRPFSAFRNGRVLAQVMRKTSGQVPWFAQFIWYRLLRKRRFLVVAAEKVDRSLSMQESRDKVLAELEQRLERSGFVAGTNTPSYADISLFAQLTSTSTFKLEAALSANSSPKVNQWYHAMCERFDMAKVPPLVPGHEIYGLQGK